MTRYIFTCGDVNGIGPEIVIKSLEKIRLNKNEQVLFICPDNVFGHYYKLLNAEKEYKTVRRIPEIDLVNSQYIVYATGNVRFSPGKSTITSGKTAVKSLELALELIDLKKSQTLITAPISKEAVSSAGFQFPGHTEFLADHDNISDYMMMFISPKMKCGLMTIHVPIRLVSKLITANKLQSKINLIVDSLRKDFGLIKPRIAVLGLNPHAGENGHIGNEEQQELIPVLNRNKAFVAGPFVPDAFFANHKYKNFDFVLGMYHDQVLIPFKMLNFVNGVNYTAGLSFIRTSPDHGTAFDIAGKGIADESSILSSFKIAKFILGNRNSV